MRTDSRWDDDSNIFTAAGNGTNRAVPPTAALENEKQTMATALDVS